MAERLVLVRGGGDLGSGTALRLWRAGFQVVIAESEKPTAVRRTVSFSEAVYEGSARVEEAVARLTMPAGIPAVLSASEIAVVVDESLSRVHQLRSRVVVDAILAKRNTGTTIDMAPLVVALGPGFIAGRDAHAVVETNRGPHLGRVIWQGAAAANTGEPGPVAGKSTQRVLRAPRDGTLSAHRCIGDIVEADDAIAAVDGSSVPAPFRGMVRGLLRDGAHVRAGMKIGDIDPRCDPELCRLVSDKSLAVAGGVLEAVAASVWGERT